MKKLYLILVLSTCVNLLEGQDTLQLPLCKYYSWVSLVNTEINIKGILNEVRDSSVVMIHFQKSEGTSLRKLTISKINFDMINIVQTRKKDSPLRGAVYGCVGGGLLGGIIGHSIEKNSSQVSITMSTYLCGVFGGILGSGIGALTGLHRKQFFINGDKMSFEVNRAKLRKYSYLH
jgi:hypothetical protein